MEDPFVPSHTTVYIETFLSCYIFILFIAGCTGNLISVVVFIKSKLQLQSTSQYLCALALVDTMYLFICFPEWLIILRKEVFLSDSLLKFYYADYSALYILYVKDVCLTLSSWLVVAFTLERFIAVVYPLRMKTLCTVTRARYIVSFLTVVAIIINLLGILTAFLYNITWSKIMTFRIFLTIITLTPPLTTTVVLNSCIIVSVYRSDRTHQNREQAHRRVTIMLLTVSSIYVILTAPAYITETMSWANFTVTINFYSIRNFFYMLQGLNFGINFYVYCIMGSNFREALQESFTWRQRCGVV